MRPLAILIAADVFGVTSELMQTVSALTAHLRPRRRRIFGRRDRAQRLLACAPPRITLCTPQPFTQTFRDESLAYASFMAHGGVAGYARSLARTLQAKTFRYDLAVGFSAGASALWLCLADAAIEPCLPHAALLYYGSRIREHAELAPRRRVRLVFAEREASFDPAPLAARLNARNIPAEVLPGTAHGFLNPLSAGYDAATIPREAERIRDLLNAPRQ